MQISILREQLCVKGALVELDGVSRDRHDEILGAAQTSGREREVCIFYSLHIPVVGLARATGSSS
jgi:hypothetical protein